MGTTSIWYLILIIDSFDIRKYLGLSNAMFLFESRREVLESYEVMRSLIISWNAKFLEIYLNSL